LLSRKKQGASLPFFVSLFVYYFDFLFPILLVFKKSTLYQKFLERQLCARFSALPNPYSQLANEMPRQAHT